jgi:hypothetical protein
MRLSLQLGRQSRTTLIALVLTASFLLPCSSNAQRSPVYRIAGVVVSKIDGHPLSRARVTLNDTKDEERAESIFTGDDGHFEFTGLPAGKYSLQGAKRGFNTSYYDQHENYWTGIVTGAGVDTENLALKLVPSAAISGQVLDESGDAVRSARVTLFRVDHSEGLEQIRPSGNVQTDDLGTYEFASLPAGTYFVSASAQPWYALHPQSQSPDAGDNGNNFHRTLDVAYPITYYADTTDAESATPIPIRGGERVQVDLHLNPVPSLHLTVHVANGKDGFSFPRLEQPAFDGSNPVEAGALRMVSPGVFEISGIAAGRYDLRMQGSGGSMEMNGVDLTSDGQEIDTSNAESLAHVKITARMSDGGAMPKPLVIGLILKNRISPATAIAADEKGDAELPQVSAGSYEIAAWGAAKRFSVAQVSAEGAELTGHTLAIAAGASVSLTLTLSAGSAELDGVVKHGGKPFGGAMVVLVPKDAGANGDLFRRDQSDLDGTFALHDVIPGSYTVIAIENGWDLDWSQPDVIAAYAKHGQVIQVRNGSNGKVHIAQPVEAQSR